MKDRLSKDGQRRLEEKSASCLGFKRKRRQGGGWTGLPSILDYLDEESQAHFLMRFVGCWKTWEYPCHWYQHGAWLGLLQPHDFWGFITVEGKWIDSLCRWVAMMGWLNTSVAPRDSWFWIWDRCGTDPSRSWKERHWITDRNRPRCLYRCP